MFQTGFPDNCFIYRHFYFGAVVRVGRGEVRFSPVKWIQSFDYINSRVTQPQPNRCKLHTSSRKVYSTRAPTRSDSLCSSEGCSREGKHLTPLPFSSLHRHQNFDGRAQTTQVRPQPNKLLFSENQKASC